MGIICSSVLKGFFNLFQYKKNEQRGRSNATLKSIQSKEKNQGRKPPSRNKYREVSGEAGEVDFA